MKAEIVVKRLDKLDKEQIYQLLKQWFHTQGGINSPGGRYVVTELEKPDSQTGCIRRTRKACLDGDFDLDKLAGFLVEKLEAEQS